MEHTADKLSDITGKFNVVFVTSYLTKHLYYSFPFNRATIVNEYFLLQSLLLSVWLQREKEMLQKPEETVRNLHTLLIALSNMKGMCVCADGFA